MPVINIESPKMSKKQRESLVKQITEISAEILEMPKESIMILIKEIDHEHVGVGGALLSNIPHP
ncbi:MAG: 2-hydroxymuconate tautomerase family protein [Methanobacterium sp.]|nr:2-hydroxymuconate tautomerase family protein [Methanobacterium sp.]